MRLNVSVRKSVSTLREPLYNKSMTMYNVEFFDSYQGTSSMDVEAKSIHHARILVNRIMGHECAGDVFVYM
jgi:16S rRNA G966 N2-methylase RsmD